jgi:hypothetical protein
LIDLERSRSGLLAFAVVRFENNSTTKNGTEAPLAPNTKAELVRALFSVEIVFLTACKR